MKWYVCFGIALLLSLSQTSCEKFWSGLLYREHEGYTYVEIDGNAYESHVDTLSYKELAPGYMRWSQGSYYFYYVRRLYHDDREILIRIKLSEQEEELVLGNSYPLEGYLYDNNMSYYVTDGWIVLHDIEYADSGFVVSGSFELIAESEDDASKLTLTNGSFYRVYCR